jgi:hypothetical protein
MRLPMPLVVADLVGAPRGDGTVDPAPYATNRIEGGQLMHYLDVVAFRRDPLSLGDLVVGRHALVADGRLMLSATDQRNGRRRWPHLTHGKEGP